MKVIIGIAVVIILGVTLYSMTSHPDEGAYVAEILRERKDKNNFMKSSSESPFGEAREIFDSLRYFPPDPRYKIKAKLEPIEKKNVVLLPTSTGEESRYLEYARVSFSLDSQPLQLLILESMDMGPTRGTLFLAFADETSTVETYGAGRYLDVKKVPGAATIELDFNKAYNPYCAYTDRFSCPLPPRENVLKIAVRAGEKSYHQ